MAARVERAYQGGLVGGTQSGIGQKVKNGTIVPHVAWFQYGRASDICNDPIDQARAVAKLGAGAVESGLRDIEHSNGIAAVQEPLSQQGATAANIENSATGTGLVDEFKRNERFRLGPAQTVVSFGLVDRFPMIFRVHIGSKAILQPAL